MMAKMKVHGISDKVMGLFGILTSTQTFLGAEFSTGRKRSRSPGEDPVPVMKIRRMGDCWTKKSLIRLHYNEESTDSCRQTISENNFSIKPKFLSDIWQLEFYEILTARAQDNTSVVYRQSKYQVYKSY